MPDYTRFREIDGVLYCWDPKQGKIKQVSVTDIDERKIPWKVVQIYIKDGDVARSKE